MVFAGQFGTVFEIRICNAVLDKQCREVRLVKGVAKVDRCDGVKGSHLRV